MPEANLIQTNFAGGEMSPMVRGRIDLDKYRNSVQLAKNVFVLQQGPAVRRSGTRYVKVVPLGVAPGPTPFYNLVPFYRNSTKNFMLMFGPGYMEVVSESDAYNLSGWLIETGVWRDTGEWQDDRIWEDVPSPTPSFSTPLDSDALTEIDYDQTSTELFITQRNNPPLVVTNPSGNTFEFNFFEFLDGPYDNENTDTDHTIALSATPTANGTSVVTASSALFHPSDANALTYRQRHFRIRGENGGDGPTQNQNQIVWGRIEVVTSATVATVRWYGGNFVDFTFPVETVAHQWRLGAFSDTTGWPQKLAFHEERIVFGNTAAQQDTVFFSKAQDFHNFAPTEYDGLVLDDNAFNVTLPASRVNSICWMETGSGIFSVGTLGMEWTISSSGSITPTNVRVSRNSTSGSREYANSFQANNSLFFLSRSGRAVTEYGFQFEVDSFVPENVNILAEHILQEGGTFCEWIFYQHNPNPTVWAVLQDGKLCSMTYNRAQSVYAWSRHEIGGNGRVLDAAVIPLDDGTEDVVYMIVEREFGSETRRYLEILQPNFRPANPDDKDNMFFVDSGITVTSPAPFTEVTGLVHLESQTVSVVADGYALDDRVVENGAITLASPANTVHVGLPYESEIVTNDFEGGSPMGTSQGKMKTIENIAVRVMDTLGFEYAVNDQEYIEAPWRDSEDNMDDSPPLLTGDVILDVPSQYNTKALVRIRQKRPYPLSVLAIMPKIEVTQ